MALLNFRIFGLKRKDSTSILNEFAVASQRLNESLKIIAGNEIMIDRWEQIISNAPLKINELSVIEKKVESKYRKKGLMDVYNKKWIAFYEALSLYNSLLESGPKFVAEQAQKAAKIRLLDSKFAKKIEELKLPQTEKEGIVMLNPIKVFLSKNPQLAIAYIKTHYYEIMKNIDTIKDTKTADIIRKIVVILSNKEVDELTRCINDVRSWPYKGAYGISLFIERGFLYINGGTSRYDKEGFLGFNMHFRDEELVKELRTNAEIKKLMTFMEELKFFSEARQTILKALQQPKWEGFLGKGGFLWNLYKGPKYIEMVRDKFGNAEFADFLSKLNGKIHEDPETWKNDLAILSEKLMKQSYQLVVAPASQTLISIFNSKINSLQERKSIALIELQQLIGKDDSTLKLRKEFLKVLAKKRKELRAELEEERLKFKLTYVKIFDQLLKVRSEYVGLVEKTIKEPDIKNIAKILNRLAQWQRFTLSHSRVLKADENVFNDDHAVRELLKIIAGNSYSIPAAEANSNVYLRVKTNHENNLVTLKDLIRIAEQDVMPMMNNYVEYIKLRLKNDFLFENNQILNNNTESNTQTSNMQKVA